MASADAQFKAGKCLLTNLDRWARGCRFACDDAQLISEDYTVEALEMQTWRLHYATAINLCDILAD